MAAAKPMMTANMITNKLAPSATFWLNISSDLGFKDSGYGEIRKSIFLVL
jgi:hypothetical protein